MCPHCVTYSEHVSPDSSQRVSLQQQHVQVRQQAERCWKTDRDTSSSHETQMRVYWQYLLVVVYWLDVDCVECCLWGQKVDCFICLSHTTQYSKWSDCCTVCTTLLSAVLFSEKGSHFIMSLSRRNPRLRCLLSWCNTMQGTGFSLLHGSLTWPDN